MRTIVIAALTAAVACGAQTAIAAPAETLKVFCGISMAEPIKALSADFEKKTGVQVDLSYGGCETLLPQVELSAPGDIFIGHAPFADLLREKGLREDRVVPLGGLRPTVVVAKGNPKKIASMKDLAREDVRVGLPDSRFATCGQMFDEAAKKAGLFDAVYARTVYQTRAHQELAAALRTGHVDVIVAWNFVAATQRDEFDIVDIGVDFPSAEIFAAQLKKAVATDAAKKYLDFLDTDAARKTFIDMGYAPVKAKAATTAKKVLKLYCAAGMQKPADEMVALFKQGHPGVEFEVIYQGSGALLAQIALSKSGDLYIAGDQAYMDHAREQGLIARVERMAVFTPVLVVPKGNPRAIKSFKDLAKDGVKLGLGDEKVAAVGRPSRELLKRENVWPAAEKNVIVTAATVDQLAIQTALKNLDAAIIWDATAGQFQDRVDVVARGDAASRVDVPIAILQFSQNKGVAEDFMKLATSPEAAEILKKNGFVPATGETQKK